MTLRVSELRHLSKNRLTSSAAFLFWESTKLSGGVAQG